MTDRVSSADTERRLIGALLLAGAPLDHVASFVSPADFVDPRHRHTFAALMCQHARGEPINFVTTFRELERTGSVAAAGGRHYLLELSQDVNTTAFVKHDASAVAEHAMVRRAAETASSIQRALEVEPPGHAALRLQAFGEEFLAMATPTQPNTAFPWFAPDRLPESSRDDDMVRDVLAPGELAALAGASQAGKTFLAIDLCVAVAGDRATFLGQRVQRHGPVLYFCAEGFKSMKKRIRAADPNGAAEKRLRLCPSVPMLLNEGSVKAALASAREIIRTELGGTKPWLLVLDTWGQSTAGANENDNGEMSAAVRGLQPFTREFGCAILLVHHARRNRQPGDSFLRGASSILAALDAALGVESLPHDGPGKLVLLTTEKQKDREPGSAWQIHLEPSGDTLRVGRVEPVQHVERELVEGQKDKARAWLRRDAILRILHGEKGGVAAAAIRKRLCAKELAGSSDAVARDLKKLREAGMVRLIGKAGAKSARYALTEKGVRAAERLASDGSDDEPDAPSSAAPPRPSFDAECPPCSSSAPAQEEAPRVPTPEPAPRASSACAEDGAHHPPQRLSPLESRECGGGAKHEPEHETVCAASVGSSTDSALGACE